MLEKNRFNDKDDKMKEEIIGKKVKGKELSFDELAFFFDGYVDGVINDDEMTLLLKAICKNGLTDDEIFNLTDIFINSGEVMDLSDLGMVVDKHSTGGVGDKTTLILAPIVASCGVRIAKMSGRALGFTGGTIDKLESICGFRVDLSDEEFKEEVRNLNMAITSQTGNLCPMDKKVYALRDVTGTTESIGLIAVSIMSKKIASGANKILIDVKVGQGALIKKIDDARELARIMIAIGNKYKKEVRCILTRMDNPLGDNIGNKIEVMEVLDILKNKKVNSLSYLVKQMAGLLVSMGKNITVDEALEEVEFVIKEGLAYNKFLEFIDYQGGEVDDLKFDVKGREVSSLKNGYIKEIDSHILGLLSMKLGAGRIKKNDKIDYNAGIILKKNVGDYVKKDEVVAELYGDKEVCLDDFYKAFKLSYFKPKKNNIILEIIG